MKYKVEFLPLASGDLEEIDAYLSQFYQSTAKKFFQEFHKKLNLLSDTPRIFAPWADNPAYRKFAVGHYLVFYQVSDDGPCPAVIIYRVIDSRRDIKTEDIHDGLEDDL